MIEVVRDAKTVMHILRQDIRSAMMVRTKELHSWIREKNKPMPVTADGTSVSFLFGKVVWNRASLTESVAERRSNF